MKSSNSNRIKVFHKALNEEVYLEPMKHSKCNSCFPDMALLADEVIRQEAVIRKLTKELSELKKQNKKPVFREPKLSGEAKKKTKSKKSKNSKPKKKQIPKVPKPVKTETVIVECEPENIPEGAKFHSSYDVVVRDIDIVLSKTVYTVKRYIHNGKIISGRAPVSGKFGSKLKALVLYLNHANHGSHPRIREILGALGFDISAGSINNILNENKEAFHKEICELLATGIKESSYIQVDDTGAFHKGDNYVSTVIGNDVFAVFRTTKSKSRTQFLETLLAEDIEYLLDAEAIAYAGFKGVSTSVLRKVAERKSMSKEDFQRYLANKQVRGEDNLRHLTEGALMSAIKQRYGKELKIVSDDAGQFDIFLRALCWIHAERPFRELVVETEAEDKEVENYRDRIWKFYKVLKRYKKYPTEQKKIKLRDQFDEFFDIQAEGVVLAEAIKNFLVKKEGLLLVLEHPFLPLHNNVSENNVREHVIRRKVSPTTKHENGKRGRDTFLSFKKTCKKLGINFFELIYDRLEGLYEIPPLSELVKERLAHT